MYKQRKQYVKALCLVVAVVVLFNGMKFFVVEAFRCVCIYCTVESRQSHHSAIIRENTTYLFENLKNFRMTNIAFWIDCCIELVLF